MDTYKKLLPEFLAFKSVSTDSFYKHDLMQTAKWLEVQFSDRGFGVDIVEGYGNPIVVARYSHDESLPTCLIYGHYDVQPAEEADGWHADPFTPHEQDGRIYGRGVVDNKGQVLIHMATVFDLIESDRLGYNIVFMIEGDEETGSPTMPDFVKEHKDKLQADFVMLSDGEIIGDQAIIDSGFRGGFNATVTLCTSSHDLHSGMYGGTVPNAAEELSLLLVKIKDKTQVCIPGFYDDVAEVTEEQLAGHALVPFSKEGYLAVTGTKECWSKEGFDVYTQSSLQPTLEVTGISSGYAGEGYRNGVPSVAVAKINCRLTPDQDPDRASKLFVDFIGAEKPDYCDIDIVVTDPYKGIMVETANQYVQKAERCLVEAFGSQPIKKYCGGGLPIVSLFDEILGIPQALIPLGNEDCVMHGVNENFSVDILNKALTFSKTFFEK